MEMWFSDIHTDGVKLSIRIWKCGFQIYIQTE